METKDWRSLYGDTIVLLPAYGRDYVTSKEAEADFLENRDFMCELSGKYANMEDLVNLFPDIKNVKLRYKNRSDSIVLKIPE